GGDDGPKITKFEMTFSLSDVKVNPTIEPATLAFKPGSASKKVEKLDFGMADAGDGHDAQAELVGKPAPAWSLKGFDGAAVKLDDFKGKVVVMDFWASWCGPCVKGLPYMQELWTKLEKKDVIFLGMNTDDNEKGIEKAKKILESKNVTIRQVSDIKGAAGTAYQVSGIPCLVIVDKAGVIQKIHTGFAPGMEKEIEAEIEKVLKGENLFKPAEKPKADEPADAAAPAKDKK
ncbi:MAG: TlpA family protein disulfide reductase, partial [Phycisphaerales bacterium]